MCTGGYVRGQNPWTRMVYTPHAPPPPVDGFTQVCVTQLLKVVGPRGFEPPTYWSPIGVSSARPPSRRNMPTGSRAHVCRSLRPSRSSSQAFARIRAATRGALVVASVLVVRFGGPAEPWTDWHAGRSARDVHDDSGSRPEVLVRRGRRGSPVGFAPLRSFRNCATRCLPPRPVRRRTTLVPCCR